MNQNFDYYNNFESPTLILCNPDKTEICALGSAFERKLTLKYNALSELSFKIPYKKDGVVTDNFNKVAYRRLIYIIDIGYFMITNVQDQDDGISLIREVDCRSLENELTFKKVTLFKGPFKFYDYITPANTFLQRMIDYAPGWTVGNVDTDLLILTRNFDVSDNSVYSLLTSEASQAYQCIFTFDTINRKINATTIPHATSNTDIYLSFNNLIKDIDLEEQSDELITAMNVYGSGDLSISTVNPLGTDTIYDFSYFKKSEWMSSSLITAVTNWEAKILIKQPIYANTLTSLKNVSGSLVTATSELATLKANLARDVGIQAARIQQGLDLSAINALIANDQSAINSKNSTITSYNNQIKSYQTSLKTINSELAITSGSNFTTAQQLELNTYIIGNTYTNKNFVQTTVMNNVEVQNMAQGLYDQAKEVLAKVAVPRYSFKLNSANFVFLKEYARFITQLNMGSVVTIELGNGSFAYPALLELSLNYDDPTDFEMVFSNRLRLDGSAFRFADLFSEQRDSSTSTVFNSENWSNWTNNYQDTVSLFISSALNAAVNNVVSGSNQQIIIDSNGLRGRTYISGSPSSGSVTYGNEQVWLVNNMLAFTADNWQHAKLAVGKISGSAYGLSGSAFGVVGDYIVGRILAGNQLSITNQGSNFTLDANGCVLNNASLTVSNTNTSVVIDPTNGIKIKKSGVDVFYADNNGNIHITGDISATTFNGQVISDANIVKDGLNAGKVAAGTMSGDRVSGGTITWPGCKLGATATGASYLTADSSVYFETANKSSALSLSNLGTSLLYGSNKVTIGGTASAHAGIVAINGYLDIRGARGVTEDYSVYTSAGYKTFRFSEGILVGVF